MAPFKFPIRNLGHCGRRKHKLSIYLKLSAVQRVYTHVYAAISFMQNTLFSASGFFFFVMVMSSTFNYSNLLSECKIRPL